MLHLDIINPNNFSCKVYLNPVTFLINLTPVTSILVTSRSNVQQPSRPRVNLHHLVTMIITRLHPPLPPLLPNSVMLTSHQLILTTTWPVQLMNVWESDQLIMITWPDQLMNTWQYQLIMTTWLYVLRRIWLLDS